MSATAGPYRLLRILGRGGFGAVHEAEHVAHGTRVALKTALHCREEQLAGIRREIRALARLDHPGIVRIVDHGVQDGQPWYAMELVAGKSLRDHLPAPTVETVARPAGTRAPGSVALRGEPRPLAPMLAILHRLCATLAYLHGEGIVHRDLKPDNVLLRSDGTPVLVDFGVTLHLGDAAGRAALDVDGGQVAGTLAYVAPEQLRGETPDARADLYSLGCILYEVVTGQPPFTAPSVSVLLARILEEPPSPPSDCVAGVPPALDALTLRLLAKDPRDRIGYAQDVATALHALGSSGSGAPLPRPRPYLYRAPVVGREQALHEVTRHLERARGGACTILLCAGESGSGKTRLAQEAVTLARARGFEVLAGDCPPTAEGRPLAALRGPLQSIADRCRARGAEEVARILGDRAPLLARYEPSLQGLPGDDHPVELPLDAARQRLWHSLHDTFAALARRQPLLLVLEDLHWADDLTLGFLETLGRRAGRSPLLVLATYRIEEARAPLRHLSEQHETISLGRLDERSIRTMVAEMMAVREPSVPLVEFLSRRSEGNPMFVAEYLRAAVDDEILSRDRDGVWQPPVQGTADFESVALPAALRGVLVRRLHALSPGAKLAAAAASVLGREMNESLLVSVAELAPADADAVLDELRLRQVLTPAPHGRIQFAHDKIREVAYADIPPDRRRRLHRVAAEAIQARVPEADLPAAVLGRHWEEAGERERARVHYLRGAREAAARYALDEAERLYDQLLRLVDAPSREGAAARNERAQVLVHRGRTREAIDEHRRALADSRALSARDLEADSLQGLVEVLRLSGALDEARGAAELALSLHRALGNEHAEATALLAVANLETSVSAESDLYHQALALARKLRDPALEARIVASLASLAGNRGDNDEARSLMEQALPIARATGDIRLQTTLLYNLANLHQQTGRSGETTEAMLDEALTLARRMGDRMREGVILGGCALLKQARGRWEEARAMSLAALAIHREAGHRSFEAATLANIGSLEQTLGANEAAEAMYRDAVALARTIEDQRIVGLVLPNLAEICRTSGSADEATLLLQEATELSRREGDRVREALALAQMAVVLGEAGQRTSALELADRAVALVPVDSPVERAKTLAVQARLLREAGQLDRAVATLARAEEALSGSDAPLSVLACLCERGHLELARGLSPGETLDRVRALAQGMSLPTGGPAARQVEHLERAIASRPVPRT